MYVSQLCPQSQAQPAFEVSRGVDYISRYLECSGGVGHLGLEQPGPIPATV